MGKLGPYELNTIVTGDAMRLAAAIPDNSVDLIFTDPVYSNIEDYEWLAETAARVLKPDRALLCFCGIGWLDLTIEAMKRGGLYYRWTLGTFQPNGPSRRGLYRSFSKWYACLFFDVSNAFKSPNHWPDMVASYSSSNFIDGHKWRKNPASFISWLKGFTIEDQIIFDPFTGGGTVPAVCKMLRRQYLAFEIDPVTADFARQRVANTQPPLPIQWPEQLSLMD